MIGPFLSLLKPKKLALITILELMRLQGSGGILEGMKTARALIAVGNAVEMEFKMDALKKNNVPLPLAASGGASNYFTKRAYRALIEQRKQDDQLVNMSEEWLADWSHVIRARVGGFLVQCLMEVATIPRTGVTKRTKKTM